MSKKKVKWRPSLSGMWIMIVAAVVLEGTAAVQYFYSRATIKAEAEQRAKTELRAAELEIEKHAVEMETAAKILASMAQRNLDHPEAMGACTRILLRTLDNVESAGIAFIPDYYPEQGHYFEMCSSWAMRPGRHDPTVKRRIYTRQIGTDNHNYFEMEWFKNGLERDSCVWCEPYLDDSGAQQMVVSCSCPVKNREGKVVAVACVDLSLSRLYHVSEYLQVYHDSYYSIRSSTGLDIVAKPDTIRGRKYLTFEEQIEATGWHISIIIPEDILYADLRRTGLIVSVLMLIGLLVLLFILYRSANDNQKLVVLNSQKERMKNELEVAQTIQMAMLPKVFPPFLDRLDLNVYGMVDPAKEIGGDLYDFYVRHDKLFFCVGDVSGKGIPASLVMATARSMFRSITSREERPENIVGEMNNELAEQNGQNMFITLFLGVLDLKTGQLDYCNAGHNAPVIMKDGKWQMVEVLPNLPLGITVDYTYQAQMTQMAYNDTIFLYTDGLTEAENIRHEQYGEDRMLNRLSDLCASLPRNLVKAMQADVETFVGKAQQSDDLTMLAVRYQMPAIVMRNDIQQIPTLAEWIEGLGIPAELNMPVNLALEEAVSNVMLYAYPHKSGQVFVEFVRVKSAENKGEEQLVFTISDSGIPFDPTKQKPADTTLSVDEREIGGLGIHLVRQLMDEVRYERSDGKNILTLVKKLTTEN